MKTQHVIDKLLQRAEIAARQPSQARKFRNIMKTIVRICVKNNYTYNEAQLSCFKRIWLLL